MQTLFLLIASLVFTRLSVTLGLRAGLVDKPDARKQNQGAVPLTGGIAIFATVLCGTVLLSIAPYSLGMLLIA